eukprot:CAMPEP_0113513440 /NCGR_PEP_ID=MMETSP0014_2-20120614/39865_1 /TAXON_ID=2857 /ORGANISM="Nitzschia sp." /LENGTH=328 /DNA_ID=CAMNT_0000409847 /DNA_START=69 /DNA_END=1055 /DNA_ORIENTATION=+ /assembly_acc=CAM_ASM_000159
MTTVTNTKMMASSSTLLLLLLLAPEVVVESFHVRTVSFHQHAAGVSNSNNSKRPEQQQAQFSSLLLPSPPPQDRLVSTILMSSSSPEDEEETTSSPPASSTSTEIAATTPAPTTPLSTTIKNAAVKLLAKLNDLGAGFKPKAQQASLDGSQAATKSAKFGYGVMSCLYYSLFILYRAYRGFFVLLPAVFKQVYVQMEDAMKSSNMVLIEAEEKELRAEGGSEGGDGEGEVYIPRKTWRTTLTVSVLATVVTASYMIGGTVQMATNFFKTLTTSSSVPKSFEAAADGMVDYESKIGKISDGTGINGATLPPPSPTADDDDDDKSGKLSP